MIKKTLMTSNNNIGIRTFTQLKYRTHKLTYDRFVLHHYAYMVMVIQEIELTCLENN
jgi:helix-turn-helix protein